MDLVTGATGFVGKKLVEKLTESGKVKVLVRDLNYKNKNVEIADGDLLNIKSLEKATKGIDTVYHLAALVGGESISYKSFYEINVVGTKNLIEACIRNKVRKFVFISSVSVMGDVLKGTESNVCKPTIKYGKSKLMAERLIKNYSRKIKFVIIRCSSIYGPGQDNSRALSQLINRIKTGKFVIFGKGGTIMSMIYVDDVVDGIILAGKSEKADNQTYILAEKRPTTIDALSDMITKEMNISPPKHVPFVIGYISAFFLTVINKITGIKVPLTLSRLRNLTASRSFVIDKAKRELKWEPKTSLEKGLRKTLK